MEEPPSGVAITDGRVVTAAHVLADKAATRDAAAAGISRGELRRIVITGIGVVNPTGTSLESLWDLIPVRERQPGASFDALRLSPPVDPKWDRPVDPDDPRLLPAPGPSAYDAWEPRTGLDTWSTPLRPHRLVSARDLVREFVQGLISLWRKADPARFARSHALRQRTGQLWGRFRPARAPGRLTVASGHVTRGPDLPRMTLVVRGELRAVG
jgi:3-oxoacyl-(acyl-carrier-protein) synthase